jgi:flagellar hook-associated protein 3 FlgL
MAIVPLNLARVSNALRGNLVGSNLAKTQAQLLRVQNELTTGKKLNLPSDEPGDAAVAMQIRKTLEKRLAYEANIREATSQLSEVDSSLGDLSSLVQQAQTIASANVGSDVTADQRKGAAEVISRLYSQILSIANKQFNGTYLFAGDRSTAAPFVEENGGVRFVGSETVLKNQYDEDATLAFQVDGGDVFGATSTRVTGRVNLAPDVTGDTRFSRLRGAAGEGVQPGLISVSNGTTTAVVDLTTADTVDDVIARINAAGLGLTASINATADGISITGAGGDNIVVNEIGGTTTARDLGILNTAGAGNTLTGGSVNAKVAGLTPIAALRGGAGVDPAGLVITNGLTTKTIDLTGVTTVEDLLNKINGSGAGVLAKVSDNARGIDIINTVQGTELRISENGGTTAADLGLRSFETATKLEVLNNDKGIRLDPNGPDLRLTNSAGTSFDVDLTGAITVQDALDRINTAATTAGAAVAATFATTGNGIVLTDTAGGVGNLTVANLGTSFAAEDLGLNVAPAAGVINGNDVAPASAEGIFANIKKLQAALQSNDQTAITASAEGLQSDYDRVARIRGVTGARVQELESRQDRLGDQNVATKALLSQLEDTDFTEAITKFQTLQTSLEASMRTSSSLLQQSLLDFLG